ncbi:MAG TPA: zinc ribbon domain-containing protein [Candidatus Latescibacteria bacterium]|nr:zinc ribbon domain-containing protein [Candidatus Latescibacterota bacterium]
MPIYEYRCEDCGKKSSFLVLRIGAPFHGKCAHCGSKKLVRLMSRFAMIRSEESRLESLADPSKWGDIDENDPKSISRWMKKMGKEMGEDLGEDFNQIVEEAEEEAAKGEETEE